MIEMKGDIVFTPFNYTDLTNSKPRPVLIIYESDLDFVGLMITSHKPSNQNIFVPIDSTHSEFSLTKLTKSSYIRIDRVATILKSHIIKKWGLIGSLLKKEIEAKFKTLYSF